jgi:putative nucleotidyltransferase with HDIG domain
MDPSISRKVLVCLIEGNDAQRVDIAIALMSFYLIQPFSESRSAMEWLETNTPAVIILDEMAAPKGLQLMLNSLRKRPHLVDVPIICTSNKLNFALPPLGNSKGISILIKPFRRSALLHAISHHVNHGVELSWESIEPVQQSALKKTVTLFNSVADIIESGAPLDFDEVKTSCLPLAQAVSRGVFKDILSGVRRHDNYTYVHSLRVATFLSLFGTTIGMQDDELAVLASGGLIHDIGKMKVPHGVLNKPDKLTEDEFEIMKEHVSTSVGLLDRSSKTPRAVTLIAAQHHEKLDGTGYPHGLKGKEINELTRMATIVDIFGALTDRRVYKDAMPPELALKMMSDMNRWLDMHLLRLFKEVLLDASNQIDLDSEALKK